MRTKRSYFYFFACIILASVTAHAQDSIVINEFMAINNSIIQDEDNDYSDWIEIYNAGTSETNLKGWYLTDDETVLNKWSFPDVALASDDYLLIFASGKNRKDSVDSLHTNFKLGGSGEYLALIKPDGTTISSEFSPEFPEQFANISYGLIDGGKQYMLNSTPDGINANEIYILPPAFSVNHGFFENTFSLEINSQQAGTEIYYTTNGSNPTLTNSTKYTAAINIITTSVVRAIATKDGNISESITASYIFLNDVINQSNNQPGYPETWLSPIHGTDDYDSIPGNYGMKYEFVNSAAVSPSIIKSLKSLPVVSIVTDIDNLFSKEIDPLTGGIYQYNGEPDGPTRNLQYHIGRGWERPASIEYFNSDISDGELDFQANCGIKIHGGATRTRAKTEKHSFKIGFKSEYGVPKLNEELFGNGAPDQYDWLVLRGSFAPRLGQQVIDPWGKLTMQDMGQYAANSKFVHVYINGLYWGMYNLSERMDENCMRDNLGGNPSDYDIIKDYYEIETGDSIAWNELVTLAQDPDNYQRILGNNPDGTPNPDYEILVNPENLIDYVLLNMFAENIDWDHHNWVASRKKTNSEGFHFLVWDSEYFFRGGIVDIVIDGGFEDRPSGIFADLLEVPEFKNLFISRINKHLFESGALIPEKNINRYNKIFSEIDTAILADQGRWEFDDSDPFNLDYHDFIYDYFPILNDRLFNRLLSKQIYPIIDFPLFNINTRKIPRDTTIYITIPDGCEVRYSLDGTDPGHYLLGETNSIYVYDGSPIPLTSDTIIIKARAKKDTLWSRLTIKQYILESDETPISIVSSENPASLKNYPNPVKEHTYFEFELESDANIRLQVYNLMGEKVDLVYDGNLNAGQHKIEWLKGNLSAGMYFGILENKSSALKSRTTFIIE